MNKLITEFSSKYPQATEMAVQVKELDMPMDIALWVSINVSILMAKLKRGDYSKNMRNPNEQLSDECIDMFGVTYLKNIKKVAEQVWYATGSYSHIKQLKSLQPDDFFEKLINQEFK
jgi:hypothetical protein